MLKKFSVGGWCGRVIIVSALSQRKRVKRERELDKIHRYSIVQLVADVIQLYIFQNNIKNKKD